MKQLTNKPNRSAGFTMIELMVVVALIGILAAVAIPALASYKNRVKAAEATNTLGAFSRAVEINWQDDGTGTPYCLGNNFSTTNAADGTVGAVGSWQDSDVTGYPFRVTDEIHYKYAAVANASNATAGGCHPSAPTVGAEIVTLYALENFDAQGTTFGGLKLVLRADGEGGLMHDGFEKIDPEISDPNAGP